MQIDIREHYEFSRETFEMLERLWEIHRDSTLNLTAIRDHDEFFLKHFLDSAYIFKEDTYSASPGWAKLRNFSSVADVGSGGGFPGFIIALLFPDAQVTLIESIAKKCRFLADTADALGLQNIEVINGRAEDVRNRTFDLITARGVGKVLPVLKWTWNLAHENSIWLMYKGERLEEELAQARSYIQKRSLQVEHVRIESPFTRTYCLLHR